MRPLLVVIACAVAPGSPLGQLGAQPQPAQTGPLPSTRAVRVQIETAQTTYRAGDTVIVRLTLTNTGDVPLYVRQAPPWGAVRLIVTGPDGQAVALADDPDYRAYHTGRPYPLRPQQPDTADYEGRQWTGLQHWGYGALPPGTYTLSAVPLVASPSVVADAATVRSNQVTFTVAP